MTGDQLAEAFHEAYERLAPAHGYETREASAKPWADVPAGNRALMTAVAGEILAGPVAALVEAARVEERERIAAAIEKRRSIEKEHTGAAGVNHYKDGRLHAFAHAAAIIRGTR